MLCLICQRETDNPKFCSRSCSGKYVSKIEKIYPDKKVNFCKNCGIETYNPNYCSQHCRALYIGNLKRKKKYCLTCGNEITNRNAGKYCSKGCDSLARKQKTDNRVDLGLITNSPKRVKQRILELRGNKCQIDGCGISEWMGKPVLLILDHIDGNSDNWLLDNLRLICSNCDAQTDTYKSKNKGSGRAFRRERYKNGKSY